jgi:hypothetical protein
MSLIGISLALAIAGIILLAALGVGVVALIKMGVLAKYILKEEPPDEGEYRLQQSREAGEE